jgi:hypothetical protein
MRGLRLLVFYLVLWMLTACGAATPAAPTQALPPERPTLLGTANPPPRAPATPIPTPATCIFRTSPTDEIGLYRFNWDNATITLNTKIGSLIVDGPRDLTPGPRQLVLLHNTQLPPQAGVIVNFDQGGTLIDDPLNDVQEVRDAGGTVVVQAMADPAGDTKGMPNYLDIVRVERSFGYYPNSVVRVYLAGIHTGQYIWSSQSVAVSVAGQTFIQSNFSDGKIGLLQTSASGKTSEWAGPVAVSGNSFAFSIQVGVDAAMSAATYTSSSSSVDAVGPYPVKEFDDIWQAVTGRCR